MIFVKKLLKNQKLKFAWRKNYRQHKFFGIFFDCQLFVTTVKTDNKLVLAFDYCTAIKKGD